MRWYNSWQCILMCDSWILLQVSMIQFYFLNWCIPIVLYEFIWYMYSFVIWTHILFELIYACHAGTNNQKKELFVMAVHSPTRKSFPGNFTIIQSAKKWVFHAIYCLDFMSLYGKHICLLNQLVMTDEDDVEYHSFETLILTHKMFRSSAVMLCTFHAIWHILRETYIICYHLKNPKMEKWFTATATCSHYVWVIY